MAGPVTPPETAEAEALAKRHFGFATLRAGQAETIARVLRGEDVLAVLPTGGGKSMCYQLPAMLGKRVTLVVSPLVALMRDQLESLPPAMRAASTSITGALDAREVRARIAEVARGRYRLLYVAPERLRSVALLRALREAGVERIVVDEAHCVSTWGHDFRPDYLAIGDVRHTLGSPQLVALTATAPPRVIEDIQARLGPLALVQTGVRRENLRLEAVLAKDADEKLAHLLQLCKETPPPGIVYANSRVKTEQLAAALRSAGVRADGYHAGLPDRHVIQDAFMANRIDVLVATVAFGMGVDKPDIRFVFHHDPSASVENHWQEAGRAGRDGEAARCVALATRADAGQLRSRAKLDVPSQALVGEVWSLILAGAGDDRRAILDPEQLDALDRDDVKCRVALSVLAEAGAIDRLPDAPRHITWDGEAMTLHDAAAKLAVAPEDVESTLVEQGATFQPGPRVILLRIHGAPERAEDVLADYVARSSRRIDEMMAYVQTKRCRHAHIAEHFGEVVAKDARCLACDVCLGIGHEIEDKGDDEADARQVLAALGGIRGIGEQNLVYMLRGDPLAPPWTDGRPGAGALGFRSASKVKALVRALEKRGLIARETLDNGGVALRLADEGAAALGSDASVLPVPPARTAAARPTATTARADRPAMPSAGESPLFDALKAWRRERADAEAVPAYVVAHDSMLAAVADARPGSADELLAIKGFGPKKIERYGEAILTIVRDTA